MDIISKNTVVLYVNLIFILSNMPKLTNKSTVPLIFIAKGNKMLALTKQNEMEQIGEIQY